MGRERYTPQQQAFYKAYLASKQWRLRKEARIRKAGGRCEWTVDTFNGPLVRCERRRYLCVHHNSYEHLGNEYDHELDVLCWAHHMLAHLLWKRCSVCSSPVLGDDQAAEKWLMVTLSQHGLDLDHGPINWKKLPNKEFLLAELPNLCSPCYHYIGGDADNYSSL